MIEMKPLYIEEGGGEYRDLSILISLFGNFGLSTINILMQGSKSMFPCRIL